MANEISANSEVYNHYLELSKPTEEDLKRDFSEKELKELCLKHKCIVNMWRWNVVHEYRIAFTESGRFQRWSDRDRLRMLAKAINKKKPSVLYDDEEIKKIRNQEWGEQLKENILSLNYWKRKRLNSPRQQVLESDDIDREIQAICDVDSESMNADELLTETEYFPNAIQSGIEVNTESLTVGALLSQSVKLSAGNTATYGKIKAKEMKKYGEVSPISDDLLIDSEDSIETVLNCELPKMHVAETLTSEEVAPEIENMYTVSTISITLDSQSEEPHMLQSEDVIPQTYENFKNIIPMTSTQSEKLET